MSTEEIIALANNLKNMYQTTNPFKIADHLGINISFSPFKKTAMQGYTYRPFDDHPPLIGINSNFDKRSQYVLCAHELGHAILHKDACNHFDDNPINNPHEYEANLFAVALLCNPDDLNFSLVNMDNYLLKSILDHNIMY